MTRIVAGSVGGRAIEVPATGTRPTSDRVREALFSRLEHVGVLVGATVWDLCRRNVARLGLTGVRVVGQRVAQFLQQATGPVDVALLDPPYDLPENELAEALAALAPHLAPNAIVVVERTSRTPEPTWPEGLARTGEKRYGETVLWFAEPA